MVSLYMYGCKGEYFGPGMADYGYKLSGGYTLEHAGTHNEVNCQVAKEQEIVIENKVTGIAWNNSFILAKHQENNKIDYWIIDVTTNKIYGPLSETEFKSKRIELKVSNKLKLEEPEKYKYLDNSEK